jgi:ribosome-binding protein aMBF1 (putative translation factor)
VLFPALNPPSRCVPSAKGYQPIGGLDPKGSYQLIRKDQEESDLVTNEQLRAARALLGWSQTELASKAGLSVPTVKRLERGFGPHVSDETRARLQKAIETAGVEFMEENGGGAGVRFRQRTKS